MFNKHELFSSHVEIEQGGHTKNSVLREGIKDPRCLQVSVCPRQVPHIRPHSMLVLAVPAMPGRAGPRQRGGQALGACLLGVVDAAVLLKRWGQV